MRAFIRDNALGLAFGAAFLLTLVAQSVSGLFDFNNQQLADGTDAIGYLDYVTSSAFAVDNARTIAPAVRAALTAIHHQHAGGSVVEDEGWLASLRADGRYLEDIWGG